MQSLSGNLTLSPINFSLFQKSVYNLFDSLTEHHTFVKKLHLQEAYIQNLYLEYE